MNRTLSSPLVHVALAAALAASASVVRADITPLAPGSTYGGDLQRAAALLKAKKIISLGEALARVPKYAHGQLLQVAFWEKSPEAGDRAAYEVYVLAEDGLIWEVVLDATSGEVLQQHPEGAPAEIR
jgi:uncharacterized membrane protein YkoI